MKNQMSIFFAKFVWLTKIVARQILRFHFKSALIEFIVSDTAFEIVHKSTWHINTMLMFAEGE